MVFSRCAYQYFLISSYTATLYYGLWKIIHSACMFVYSYNMNVNGFKWCGMDSNGMFMRCPNGHRLLAIYPTSAQDTNCPIQHWQREWFKKPNMKKVAGILESETSYIEISSNNCGSLYLPLAKVVLQKSGQLMFECGLSCYSSTFQKLRELSI